MVKTYLPVIIIDPDEERRKTESGFDPPPDDIVREQVCAALAGGYMPEDIYELFIDKLTGLVFDVERFKKVFARDIANGGKLAHIKVMGALYGIATRGSSSKGAASQVRAAEHWLERRDRDNWGPAPKKVEITDLTAETSQKADDALNMMKEAMDKMAAEKKELEVLERLRSEQKLKEMGF